MIFTLAIAAIPALGVLVLLIPHQPLDVITYLLMLLLWVAASLGYMVMLGHLGFFDWALKGPPTRIIIPRPCRCGMAFPAKDRLFHSVVREDDLRLRLACTGEGTEHRAFYITGRKAKTIGDVALAHQCPRPGCRDAFEANIHPACPQHGHHRIEPA